jgi:GH15 family glucan-1,4-alpha-glucosidase
MARHSDDSQKTEDDASHEGAGHQDRGHKDASHKDASHKDASHKDASHTDASHEDPAHGDPGHEDPAREGSTHGDASRYPPIADYALIGDCHSVALVSRAGSIDWCCMTRFDSGSCFGRLLDWDKGGYCEILPEHDGYEASRRYVDDTLVLETTLRVDGGEVRVLDCFTVRTGGSWPPNQQLLRVIEGVRGRVRLRVRIAPRFDYGSVEPWLRKFDRHVFTAVGGDDALAVSGDLPLERNGDHDLEATFDVRGGERFRLSLVAVRPEDSDHGPPALASPDELDRRLQATLGWWRDWSSKVSVDGQVIPEVRRSAVVLKALTNAPTGAIAAAATTSLPESLGGERNWDYRYSWVRDSQFTVRSLGEVGRTAEAEGFRRFIERSAAGGASGLQIVYGVGGERRLTEVELDYLEGYCGSAPVRVGNAASEQFQLDVFGELLDLSWRWHQRGRSPDDDYWRFLVSLVDTAAQRWDQPDRGLWEMRGEPQHFVHSKAMCWAALDRGIRLAESCLRQAPLDRWKATRDDIREAIETRGYDEQAGSYMQAFGSSNFDASVLLLPSVDYLPYDHPRMVSTTDAIRRELSDGGLIRRYRADDGLGGKEGVFLACTFWLVECLAHQGRVEDARQLFDAAAATCNHLGLFSEEYDVGSRRALGNFPQGLTHLSHIAASVALVRATEAMA